MKLLCTVLATSFAYWVEPTAGDSKCDAINGDCLDWRYYKCTAGYESGLCSGDNNRKCCNNCNATCKRQEEQNSKNDGACTSQNGECKHNTNYCNGSYSGGMCGGDSSRQCCKAGGSSGGKCSLQTYSATNIKGYNGLKVQIDSGFKRSMDNMNSYARQCSVTVHVTHAFRKEGQNIGGTVVPPASTSNHLVGQAIDCNLDTPSGWCNGDCMAAQRNSASKCFTDKVNSDRNIRWGNSFNDPVHFDSGLNLNDKNKWDQLYYEHQGNC